MAQVDSWPLTSRITTSKRSFAGTTTQLSSSSSPERHPASTATSFSSPISPRQRKAHARQSLLDESKSKPLLLQELQAFVASELAELALDAQTEQRGDGAAEDGENGGRRPPAGAISANNWCLQQRLQVFRQVFQQLIASFSVYAPLLSQIQHEYELVIHKLKSQCLQIPKLHAQLQTLQTQCLHELSAHKVDTKQRVQTLKRQLKTTQGRLAASAAQNALYQEQNLALQAQIGKLEKRSEEMQLSNHSLVHGMKRHDETLRHIHERSREDTMALQQVTSKYHHACEEIAELKKTIATLEEKVGGVHVAADKATIALLTRELQETHAKLLVQQHTLSSGSVTAVVSSDAVQQQQSVLQQTALNQVFVRVLERQGVHVDLSELLGMLSSHSAARGCASGMLTPRLSSSSPSASASSSSKAVVATALSEHADAPERLALWILDKLQTRLADFAKSDSTGAAGSAATFLTEPEEQRSLATASHLLSPSSSLSCTSDFFPGQGVGANIPEYLQCDGVVRNLYYPRKKLEQILMRVWQQKDDLEKAKRSHVAGNSASCSSSSASASANPSGAGQRNVVPLAKVFWMVLTRMYPSQADAVECAYNTVAALERFSLHSSDCRLFQLILQQEIPEEARMDQVKELYAVHDALAALDKERNAVGAGAGLGHADGREPSLCAVPGRVPLADVIQSLRHVFPWKTEAALSALYRALLIDQRGNPQVDYAALLLLSQQQVEKESKRQRARSQFAECLRAQHLDDLLAYRKHLQHKIQQKLLSGGGGSSATTSSDAVGQVPGVSEATPAAPTLPTSAALSKSEAAKLANSGDTTPSVATNAMVSIRMLRAFLQECDVAKPVQEINALLSTASGLSMDQILTQDAMMLHAQQFVKKLPTLLVKPTGKFQVSASSSLS